MAKQHEERASKYRRERLARQDTEELAFAFFAVNDAVSGPVLPFCQNPGDFAYQGFTDAIYFEGWQDFTLSPDYPGKFSETGRDYLQCRLIGVFSEAIDQLVANNAFACLNLDTAFRVGFCFHDGPEFVVRVINW
jgi:hypothetical protein